MELNQVSVELFTTKDFILSFLNKKYKLLPNYEGFIKNKYSLTLFKTMNLDKYLGQFEKITLMNISENEYKIFCKSGIKHTKNKEFSTILFIERKYFNDIYGKNNRNLRNSINKFTLKYKIETLDKPRAYLDYYDFIKVWESIRKYAHHFLVTGYDKNYFSKFLFNHKGNLFAKFFYHENTLVGFSIIEHVKENLFNYLFRKADTTYNGLTQFIDFTTFQSISRIFNMDIIVNMGSDMGDKKLRYYKTHSFHVDMLELITYKIKIKNEKVKL